jgi:hypothetical protein
MLNLQQVIYLPTIGWINKGRALSADQQKGRGVVVMAYLVINNFRRGIQAFRYQPPKKTQSH